MAPPINLDAGARLTPGKLKFALLGAVFCFLALIGALLALGDLWYGWLAFGLFGIASATCFASLIPACAHLALDREGFTMRSMFTRRRHRWADVQPFYTGFVNRTETVVYNIADPNTRSAARAKIGDIRGYDYWLPGGYGMTPADLAAYLNEWREAALA
jgi:hypothetical protein